MTRSDDLPRRTDKPEEKVTLTGMLCASFEEQPVFVHLGGSDDLYVVGADDEAVLRHFMGKAQSEFDKTKRLTDGRKFLDYKIKRITDAREFLDSFPLSFEGRAIRFALNPREVGEGRIRWLEVQRA
jgi:hypothetical protein